MSAPLPTLPPAPSRWAVVRRMFRRNRPAVWGLRVTVVLVLLAIYAPLLACDVPLLWREPGQGLRSPWIERLFDRITWEHGVDRFFNSLLVTATLGGLLAVAYRVSMRTRPRTWRWGRWYAGVALLLALVQASGWALVRSVPYEDFARDPERLVELGGYGARWAERTLARSPETAELVRGTALSTTADLVARWVREGAADDRAPALAATHFRDLADRIVAWAKDKSDRETTDPLDAAGALRRGAERYEAAQAARARGDDWIAVRALVPYGHGDQRGGREEQFLGFLERADHLFGTDIQGRDIFARILYGTRISLTIGLIAVGIYVTIGTILGALAGYFGRRVDLVIMRLVEVVICVPSLFLIMLIVALTENKSIFLIMVAIGLVGWTGITRLVRGQFLRERALDYVTAARALGLPTRRVIFRHVLPNAFAPVLVAATFGVAAAILTENTLSFIGLGDPTVPSWGRVLNDGRDSGYWHLILPPTFAIFITVTALNLVGDGVRDALDPKLRN